MTLEKPSIIHVQDSLTFVSEAGMSEGSLYVEATY